LTSRHRIVALLALLLAVASLVTSPALAQEERPTVREIRVDGLYRVSAESVLRHIMTAVGQPLDPSVVSEDIKRIYRMGFFDDVRVAEKPMDGGVSLLYQVLERPTINEVKYIGNDELDEEDLSKVVDIRRYSILSVPQIQRNIQKMKELYVEEGYYLADVEYELTPLPQNLVDLTFKFREGNEVSVKSITILGNENVDDDELRGALFTREGHWLSFLDQSGQFKREMFSTDLQRLQFVYLSKGYIHAKVHDPVVTLSPDKRFMHITIRVDEGDQYYTGEVDIVGDFLKEHPKEELLEEVDLVKGDVLSRKVILEDTIKLGNIYKDEGYANVSISNTSSPDEKNRIVDFTYVIQKGDPVHFGLITIEGNLTTRDKVIRREMTISEGQLYTETGLQESRAEIMRLGFFEDVQIKTRQSARDDRMDVVVTVKERDTGTFQIGAGFSSIENFILTAQIAKQNLFGRGQTLSFQATLSSIRTLFNISFFDPYFIDTDFTFGFELFNYDSDFNDFTRESIGGSVSWGYRFTRDLLAALTYKIENVDVSIGGRTGRSTIPIANLFQSGLTSSLRFTFTHDSRDNRLFPTSGWYNQASVEWAGEQIGSANEFVRLQANSRFYVPLPLGMVFKVNGRIGYITGIGDKPVPIFERFFVGGIFSVRGFDRNTLGPELSVAGIREPDTTLAGFNIGGNKQLIINTEVEIPIFEQVGIRGVVFVDTGQAYDDGSPIDLAELRYSAGFGIRWWSPVGPLRFEWGFPLDRREDEEPVVFEFTIGNSF
jgi:outer membrane protein insertion porin family